MLLKIIAFSLMFIVSLVFAKEEVSKFSTDKKFTYEMLKPEIEKYKINKETNKPYLFQCAAELYISKFEMGSLSVFIDTLTGSYHVCANNLQDCFVDDSMRGKETTVVHSSKEHGLTNYLYSKEEKEKFVAEQKKINEKYKYLQGSAVKGTDYDSKLVNLMINKIEKQNLEFRNELSIMEDDLNTIVDIPNFKKMFSNDVDKIEKCVDMDYAKYLLPENYIISKEDNIRNAKLMCIRHQINKIFSRKKELEIKLRNLENELKHSSGNSTINGQISIVKSEMANIDNLFQVPIIKFLKSYEKNAATEYEINNLKNSCPFLSEVLDYYYLTKTSSGTSKQKNNKKNSGAVAK